MFKLKNNNDFTEGQLTLLASAIRESLTEINSRVRYGADGKGLLKIVFDDPESIKPEHRNDPDFAMDMLSLNIAVTLFQLAADGFPLPPYNI